MGPHVPAYHNKSAHVFHAAQVLAGEQLMNIPYFAKALQAVSLPGDADTPHFASIHSSLFSAPSSAAPYGDPQSEVMGVSKNIGMAES